MQEAGNPISVVTEMVGNEEYIENLSLQQDKYFNAGVMVIDYKKWLKSLVTIYLFKICICLKIK